jgi:transposase
VDRVIAPFAPQRDRLASAPGIDKKIAEAIIGEIGVDMSRFPSAAHLASWAGMCPGNNESAGKRRTGKTCRGSRWLRTALVQAAWAASHSRMYRSWVPLCSASSCDVVGPISARVL